jgi:hypothetical protein
VNLTKYPLQATHAEGQLEKGTPHTIDYGHGDKAATVEPSTIGQAPKDHSANLPSTSSDEAPAPQTYMQQVQNAATSAYDATTSAAGTVTSKVKGALGGATEESGEAQAEKGNEGVSGAVKSEEGKGLEELEDKHVEGFLRDKYSSSS